MSGVALQDVVVGYDAGPVLHGVSLNVPEGSLVAIVGPSGCGKTTLLRTIAGLVRARSGTIRLGGQMVTTHGIHLAPEKRSIGWVPQDAALFPHLTVAENVAFGLGNRRGVGRGNTTGSVRGTARKSARSARVHHLLDLVDLAALADRTPAQLSGGQAQRVALARALAGVPDVILLDEPFGPLDPMLRTELRGEVRALLKAEGMTGILVTHDQAEALSIADYVAVMNGGEVLQFGRPEDVYRRPATQWVANFVGDAVFLPGVWDDGKVVCALGRLDAEWAPADDSAPTRTKPTEPGGRVTVLVRPEEIELSPMTDATHHDRGDGASHPAIVVGVSYTGHDAMLELLLEDGSRIASRVTAAGLQPVGSRVAARVRGSVLIYPAPAVEAVMPVNAAPSKTETSTALSPTR